jgi:uncharacterized damage-inducible protein DinB
MTGLPARREAAPYYFTYIDQVSSPDIVGALEAQLEEAPAFFRGITEEKSLHRYAPDKWSIRQVLNHVNDTERLFLSRAFWFARNFDSPLPSFDQNICANAAAADDFSWASHVEEFRTIRLATLAFFRKLPEKAWMRSGIASGNPFTVRALAYITAGHVTHHTAIIRDKYL